MLLTTAVTRPDAAVAEAYATVHDSFDDRLDETLDAMFRSLERGRVGQSSRCCHAWARDSRRHSRTRRSSPASTPWHRKYWAPEPAAFNRWLRERTLSTIGHATLAAARQICPEHDPESVIVDIEPGYDSDNGPRTGEIWLSESSIGGGGFIEALAARVRPDPRRFLRLIMRATQPSTYELVDSHLQRVIDLMTTDDDLAALVNDFRSAPDQATRVAGARTDPGCPSPIRDLRRRTVGGVLALRVAFCGQARRRRPTPRWRRVTTEWKSEERRLGVEIPPRTWAYLMRDAIRPGRWPGARGGGDERQRMDAVQSLLWPRGWQLRAEQLQRVESLRREPACGPRGAARRSLRRAIRRSLS